MKVKFDIKDGNSSHNDGVRYTVFEVKEQSPFYYAENTITKSKELMSFDKYKK